MAYVYLRNDTTGQQLGAVDAVTLSVQEHAGDAEMWTLAETGTSAVTLTSAVAGAVLTGVAVPARRESYGEVGRALKLSLDGATVDDAGATVGEVGVFTALTGPTKLPMRCVWQRKIYSVGPSFTSSLNMLAEI